MYLCVFEMICQLCCNVSIAAKHMPHGVVLLLNLYIVCNLEFKFEI